MLGELRMSLRSTSSDQFCTVAARQKDNINQQFLFFNLLASSQRLILTIDQIIYTLYIYLCICICIYTAISWQLVASFTIRQPVKFIIVIFIKTQCAALGGPINHKKFSTPSNHLNHPSATQSPTHLATQSFRRVAVDKVSPRAPLSSRRPRDTATRSSRVPFTFVNLLTYGIFNSVKFLSPVIVDKSGV